MNYMHSATVLMATPDPFYKTRELSRTARIRSQCLMTSFPMPPLTDQRTSSRPTKRTLVRWNSELDQSLLLFIISVCRRNGIRIPFDQVAREMGSPVTEGAIVQHVDKLRKKLEEMNVVPVPPGPQRLGIPQGKVYHGQGKVYMDVKEESMVGLPLYGSRYEQEPQVSNKVNYISGGLQEARKLVPKKPSNSPKRKAAFTPRKASKRKAIETDTAQIIEISDDDDAGDMIKKEQYESADEEIDRALVIDRPNQGANGFGVDGEAETGSFEWTFESGTSSDSRNEMPQPPPTSVQRKFRRVRMMEVEEEWSEVAHGLPV